MIYYNWSTAIIINIILHNIFKTYMYKNIYKNYVIHNLQVYFATQFENF